MIRSRCRCRYTMHLGEYSFEAGCGRVHVQGDEWAAPEEVQVEGVDEWIGRICPQCGRALLDMQKAWRTAKEDQHAWQMSLPVEQRRPQYRSIVGDPFEAIKYDYGGLRGSGTGCRAPQASPTKPEGRK